MKRDWDLVRKVLFDLEGVDGQSSEGTSIEDADLAYTYIILADAGYLVIGDMVQLGSGVYNVIPSRLTWSGHEFLDSIRKDTIWKKVFGKIGKTSASVTADIVKELAVSYIKAELGS